MRHKAVGSKILVFDQTPPMHLAPHHPLILFHLHPPVVLSLPHLLRQPPHLLPQLHLQ